MSEPASSSSASPVSSAAPRPTTASKAPKPATRRTRVIAIANQKGGVGKSTTAVSLGAALADNGHGTLVIDLDPQGNASTGMGIRHEAREITVYDVLASDAPIEDSIVPTAVPGLSAIPSTIDLAGAEIELVSQFSREAKLKKAIEPLRQANAYEFIILDCPPSLGLLTVNALTAAKELIVPIQCEYYALEGLGQLLRNVGLVQQNINLDLRLSGIVMTMFDPRTKLSEQVVDEVKKYFGDLVYDVIIPRTVRLSEAPGFGQPITVYDPKSKGAESYRRLAVEVAEREPPAGPMPSFENLPTVVLPAVGQVSGDTSALEMEEEAEEATPPPPAQVPAEPASSPVSASQKPMKASPLPVSEPKPRPEAADRVPTRPQPGTKPVGEAVTAPRRAATDAKPTQVPKPAQAPQTRAVPKPAQAPQTPAPPKPQTQPRAAPKPQPKPKAAPQPQPKPKAAPQPQPKAAPAAASSAASPRAARPTPPARRSEPRESAVAELDEDLWEPPEHAPVDERIPPKADAPSARQPGQGPPPKVVVIDEDSDRGRVPDQASRSSSGIGATLEQEGKRPRRWRLFRKGGE